MTLATAAWLAFALSVPSWGATFQGWTSVRSLGSSVPSAAARDLIGAEGFIELSWNPIPLDGGAAETYRIFRAVRPGGQNFARPYAQVQGRKFIDRNIKPFTEYYYVVRPVAAGATAELTPSADAEILVHAAPDNMALVHRWMANAEICGLMGKKPNRESHYTCPYTGPGTLGGLYDLRDSFFLDRYESGCKYTLGRICKGRPCIGVAQPGNIGAPQGTVFYERATGTCLINVGSADENDWIGVISELTGSDQLAKMVSNERGLPPLVKVDQTTAWEACRSTRVGKVRKRLPRRREQVVAAAWSSADQRQATLPDGRFVSVNQLEDGSQSHAKKAGRFYCNSALAKGLQDEFENSDLPKNLDTLPATRASEVRSMRTGSSATRNCVSRYGMQDMVGNVWEWAADRIKVVDGGEHDPAEDALDAEADDLQAWSSKGISPGPLHQQGSGFLPALGLPWGGDANADGVIAKSSWENLHDDYFWPGAGGVRAMLAGGGWWNLAGGEFKTGAPNGRFMSRIDLPPSHHYTDIGFRCALDIP